MKRILFLAMVALAALLALTAPSATKADPIEGTGFIWGPNGNWMEMREPLNHGAVFKAIAMAVDGNTISQRLLGGPHMVIGVEDASPGTVVMGGSDVFAPDQARELLAEDRVSDLTLTIAGDPAVPPTMQIAEAIASDLRTNIGANVTVVEQSKGHADYIVRKATQPPPPADLPFEYTCTPNTFRPNLWVPVECVFRITNNGSSAVEGVYLFIAAFEGDVVPMTFSMSRTVNGKPVSLDDVPAQYGETVEPGQTLEVREVVLFRFDGEGEGKAEWMVSAGRRTIAAGTFPYSASADALEPSQDLSVMRKTMENADGKLWYRTTIANEGSKTVSELRLTEHYSEDVHFGGPLPRASSEQPDVGMAIWDLPALGKQALAPGESVSVDTWYSGHVDSGCVWVQSGVMVEATVNGANERYAEAGHPWRGPRLVPVSSYEDHDLQRSRAADRHLTGRRATNV